MKTSEPRRKELGLFEGYGIELEYMIVGKETADVLAVADRVLFAAPSNAHHANEVVFEDVSWSNELALHVLELKTTMPRPSMVGLHVDFQEHVRKVNASLQAEGAMLMPTSMHPWMDPESETKLWPHGNRVIYNTYNQLFNCKGHGWSNLQSVHLNLPFSGDAEFFALHEAIRPLLPLLPALAASSPLVEGRLGNYLDMRLSFYKDNQKRIPSIIGDYVPESVWDMKDYHRKILDLIEGDIRPLDPSGVLEAEWVNSRTAIARFERSAIEIRLLDIQECPKADIAVTYFASEVLKVLVDFFLEKRRELAREAREWGPLLLPPAMLKDIFLRVVEKGTTATISERPYLDFLSKLGRKEKSSAPVPVKEVIGFLLELVRANSEGPQVKEYFDHVKFILDEGCLASRIKKSLGPDFDRRRIKQVYLELCGCLQEGRIFGR